MKIKVLLITCIAISALTGCDVVNQLRTDTYFTKRNSDGDRCSFEKKYLNEIGPFNYDWVWKCPLTKKEIAKNEEVYLKSIVENSRLSSLLSSEDYLSKRDKEPLRSYVIKIKADGKVTGEELNKIYQLMKDLEPVVARPTLAEIKADKHSKLVEKL